jgi:hypothetical protein
MTQTKEAVMGNVVKWLGLAWTIAKKFDFEECQLIWEEVLQAIEAIKAVKGASKKDKAGAIIKAGEELVDIYEEVIEAYND